MDGANVNVNANTNRLRYPAIRALCAPAIRIDYCVYGWQLEHKGEIEHSTHVSWQRGSKVLALWLAPSANTNTSSLES